MNIVEPKYKSKETGREIFSSSNEIKNRDLIDLANSDLVSGNIVNYSDSSFMFETDKLMLPRFIEGDFSKGYTIIGLPIRISDLTKEERRSIVPRLHKSIFDTSKVDFIKNQFDINNQIDRLSQSGRDNIAEILRTFFDINLVKKFEINIKLLSDEDQSTYFLIETKPLVNLEEIFNNYIEAIVYQNTIYKSKVGSEKLCFCPTETVLGEEISSIINLFNTVSREIRNLISIDLVNVIEEIKNTTIDEYLIEESRITGIELERTKVIYFKNICFPFGTTALITDIQTGNLNLVYLKRQIKFLPLELDISEHLDLFDKIIQLNEVSNL